MKLQLLERPRRQRGHITVQLVGVQTPATKHGRLVLHTERVQPSSKHPAAPTAAPMVAVTHSCVSFAAELMAPGISPSM